MIYSDSATDASNQLKHVIGSRQPLSESTFSSKSRMLQVSKLGPSSQKGLAAEDLEQLRFMVDSEVKREVKAYLDAHLP